MSTFVRDFKLEDDVKEIITIEDEGSSENEMAYGPEERSNEIEAVYLEEDVLLNDTDDGLVVFCTNSYDGATACGNTSKVVANPPVDPISESESPTDRNSTGKQTDGVRYATHNPDPIDTSKILYKIPNCDEFLNEDLLSVDPRDDAAAESSTGCNICGKLFDSRQGLEIHKIVHTGEKFYKCEVCKQVFISETQCKNHQRMHRVEKLFKCSKCRESFWLRRELRAHLLTHKPDHFKCTVCPKQYKQRWYLNTHISFHKNIKTKPLELRAVCDGLKGKDPEFIATKTDVVQYKCTECGKQLADEAKFQTHMKLHADPSGSSCILCDRSFASPKSLNLHRIIHTGDVFYSCDVCDKVFLSEVTFKEHRAAHESDTHACEVCNKAFAHETTLTEHRQLHMRTRTLSKCDKCGRAFKKQVNLTKHQAGCGVARSSVCPICDKEFASPAKLKDHELKHGGNGLETCYSASEEDKEMKIDIEECVL